MNAARLRAAEPIDPAITSIQPGGGRCMRLELAWGGFRRWRLRRFFPGYVERMASLRRGDRNPAPFDVLDPRDVKYFRNQPGAWHWKREHDPFVGRDDWPFARVGLCELLVIGGGFGLLTAALIAAALYATLSASLGSNVWIVGFAWLLVAISAFVTGSVVWFFRNPRRIPPLEPGVLASPADGKIVEIREIEHDPYIGGPAVQIGIFLSVFNVHINRVPSSCRVVGVEYRPGEFLNALLAASAIKNERVTVRLEETATPFRGLIVRQIAGAIASRIVCWIQPGDALDIGAQFGMIKLGSRTELLFPREPGLEVLARLGQRVVAGETLLARYRS